MATTGSALTIPFTIGTGQIVGQGTKPDLWVLYSTDDLSASPPVWIDATEYVRSFSISRGRDRELSDVDAGTAQIVLDNRARTFDPLHNSSIRPRNRWWIREQFTGETQDLFFGYAESYDQQWPDGSGIKDAVAVVNLVDEFKLLAQYRLPTMDPPRDTYADVVMSDNPAGYWRFHFNPENALLTQPEVGSVGLASKGGGSVSFGQAPAIVGEIELEGATSDTMQALQTTAAYASWDPSSRYAANLTGDQDAPSGWYGIPAGAVGDMVGKSAFTIAMWFKSSEAAPAAQREIATGPLSSGNPQWGITLNTDGTISVFVRNSGGTLYTATSSSTITADAWYHLVFVFTGGNTILPYLNGAQVGGNTGVTGTPGAVDSDDAGTAFNNYWTIGDEDVPGGTRYFDELAIYNDDLSSARILAHYTAGAERGYPEQDPGARLNSILDDISSRAPREIRSGSREMTAVFQTGQPALSEMRKAQAAENVDAVLFVARDGTISFLDDGHRSVSPWDTVQATFDDDGTDLPYHGLDVDYSDSFLANVVNVTRVNGNTTSVSDSDSIAAYGQTEPISLTDLPITTESDQEDIADGILAKVKDPMYRFVSMDLTCADPDLIEAVFQRDIGDRIRIFRTAPGGGSRIDQTVFIQRIEIQGDPSRIFRVRWAVTPL